VLTMPLSRTPDKSLNREDACVGAANPASAVIEQRAHLRFDKAFPVRVESILFGEFHCVARNISEGGIFLETRDVLPLAAHIRVCFLTPDETGEVIALGIVRNHYFINFSHKGREDAVTGMGIRFTGFDQEGERHLRACLDRFRVLH